MTDGPLVSVLMGVYNEEHYLEKTLKCLIDQTYENWECFIVDDCSNDRTSDILKSFALNDHRMHVLHNSENKRIAWSINSIKDLATGKYIVRTDGDDISRRDRIERQVKFMESHPELDMSCSRWFNMDGESIIPIFPLRRCEADMVRSLFLFYNPIGQSASIFKREVFVKYGYDESFNYTEDLDLFVRMIEDDRRIAIQDEYLLLYRIHENQVSSVYQSVQREEYKKIISRMYEKLLFPINDDELNFLTDKIYYRDRFSPKVFGNLVRKIKEYSKDKDQFTSKGIKYAACEVLLMRRKLVSSYVDWVIELIRLDLIFVIKEVFRRALVLTDTKNKCASQLKMF